MGVGPEYRLPGEFEPHRASWLMWPVRPDNWRRGAYHAQHDILTLASTIAHFEPVRLAAPPDVVPALQRRVPRNVTVVAMEYDDIWVRDTGPLTLVGKDPDHLATDWRFNSWGGLFSSASADDRVAARIAEFEEFSSVEISTVLEGGAVMCDGAGTVLVTAESILAENRNPGLTRQAVEALFAEHLNIQNVVWIPKGLANDESGGHVDNVCAFASAQKLIVATTEDRAHPSYAALKEALEVLASARNVAGEPYEICTVPLPDRTEILREEAAEFSAAQGTIQRQPGTPLAPSHINFYVVNDAVVVPTFGSSTDGSALDTIAGCFPDRMVIPFKSREFLLGGGAVHCLTKEIPL